MNEPATRPQTPLAHNPYAAGCAWIEHAYVPMADARIPINDAGFTRSDCTYDVVSVWRGRFFRLGDHLARFERSWTALHLRPPLSAAEMREVLFECVRRSRLQDAYVEMIVTRGVPPPGERDPRKFDNRFYAFAIPYVWIVKPDDQLVGSHLVVARTTTRIDPRAVDPAVKNFHWGDLSKGMLEAAERGATTAVLLNGAGEITEGPGFNVFALHQGTLYTPASGVLQGITRMTVIELAKRAGIATSVSMFGADTLRSASEIFLTSTAGGIMPVTRLDGECVGDGHPGPVTLALRQAYWDAHADDAWSTAVPY